MVFEIIKFIIYSLLIVAISKYLLVKLLRKLAEALALKPKTVGNVAGIATSVPELLTVSFSAFTGFMDASAYNILSSNVINLVQYLASIFMNKNQKVFQNKAIKIDLVLVAITIIIPIVLLISNIEMKVSIIPIFGILFFLFYIINSNVHKLYLEKEDKVIEKQIEQEENQIKGKKGIIISYSFYLILIGILLFIVGNLLSGTLENLCILFHIPQFVIGIALGFITSIPELITFFESQKHYKKIQDSELGVVEATNNLLTSNILNLFIIQAIGIAIFSIVMYV